MSPTKRGSKEGGSREKVKKKKKSKKGGGGTPTPKKGSKEKALRIVVRYGPGEVDLERVEEIGVEVDDGIAMFERLGDRYVDPAVGKIRKQKLETDILVVCLASIRRIASVNSS